jgi:hypothetical protein
MNQLLVFTLGIIFGVVVLLVSQGIKDEAESRRSSRFFGEQNARFVEELGKANDTSKPPVPDPGKEGLN